MGVEKSQMAVVCLMSPRGVQTSRKSRHASSGFSLCECQVIVDYKFVNFETFLRHFSQECPKKEILMHSNKTLT